jgi:uncharacterized membrane protein
MPDDTDWWLLVPRPLRRLPADLVAIVVLVAATDIAALAPVISETPLRIVLGLPFVLFLPGYAFVAALFPEEGRSPTGDAEGTPDNETGEGDEGRRLSRDGIDGIERTALSFGLSVAISPLIGLVLNFTPLGIRLVPIVLAISGFTLLMTGAAAVRRWTLPAEERFRVPYRRWYDELHASILQPETRTDAVLNVVLVLSLLLAVSSVSYAVMFPKQGESFSALYLLTENESGELVASDYPQNFTVGESKPLIVGVNNHEHQSMNYSLIVELQRVRFGENNSTRVLEEERLHRFSPTIGANETWRERHQVEPTMTGERLRLAYLLYRGTPPGEPTVNNAYRETHLWVNVTTSA